MTGWAEIAMGVFRRRYEPMDVSVTVGNARFGLNSDIGAPIYAHERVPAHLEEFERPKLAGFIADGRERVDEWREVVLDWPVTVGRLRAALHDGDRLAPGHGAVVEAAFAATQQEDLQAVADLICELYGAGVSVDDAVQAGGDRWPFPAGGMSGAVNDGYRQLAAAVREDGA